MSKLYLITGFLGAGKTTLLKKLITTWQDQKLAVIVNEFGQEGIDGKIISETGVMTEEISNGSIFCSCKLDKFIEVLQDVIKREPETIIVEASGLSDPTNIKKIIDKVNIFESVEYMGSICLVDAHNFHRVIKTAQVCRKQVKASDIAVINKIDLADKDQVIEIENNLRELNPYLIIHHTTYGTLQKEWLIGMKEQAIKERKKEIQTRDIGLQKFLISIKEELSYNECVKFIEMFIEDTYRIKGFVKLEGQTYLVDCVGIDVILTPYRGETVVENQMVILAGAGMPTYKSLMKASEWYCKHSIIIEQ